MVNKKNRNDARLKRHFRVRRRVTGTSECPRLNVFRSAKHIYAQLIDDVTGTTLVSASSLEKEFQGSGANKEGAKQVGTMVGKKAIDKGITKVVFDRGGYLYHGRVAELATAAREAGLQF